MECLFTVKTIDFATVPNRILSSYGPQRVLVRTRTATAPVPYRAVCSYDPGRVRACCVRWSVPQAYRVPYLNRHAQGTVRYGRKDNIFTVAWLPLGECIINLAFSYCLVKLTKRP